MIKPSKLEIIYGAEIKDKIINSNVLVVGAGGIGCELMKTLSVTGFQKISIIDLDTIDVSNLNRQFLFRKEHVGKPKSLVLKEQIQKQNSKIQVESYNGKIQEEQFGFKFFSKFDVVINALDNEEARKHVNNLCFNLGIPLIDSGTNGYEATCISICKGQTPCYQCVDRKADQSFPVCTIRQKPEKLIHCIVWAKALFEGIYGPKDQANNIIEDIIEGLEKASYNDNPITFTQILFDKIFNDEPLELQQNQQAMLEAPNLDESEKSSIREFQKKIKILVFNDYKFQLEEDLKNPYYSLNKPSSDIENRMNILNLKDYIYMFATSIIKLHQGRKEQTGGMPFDKDNDLIVDFVASASNIRAFNFSIPMESKFKIKEMAGKIIPAISSSNALVASLQVFEAIKVLSKKFDQLQGVVYQRISDSRLQSFKRKNDDPKSDCTICSNDQKYLFCFEVKDLAASKLSDLINKMLEELNFEKNLLIEFNSNIIYEYDQEMDEDETEMYEKRLKKSLADLGIMNNSIIQIQCTFKETPDQQESVYAQIITNNLLKQPILLQLLKKGTHGEKKKVVVRRDDMLEIDSDDAEIQYGEKPNNNNGFNSSHNNSISGQNKGLIGKRPQRDEGQSNIDGQGSYDEGHNQNNNGKPHNNKRAKKD